MKKATSYHAIGKRKTSVARVYLQPGEGKITVNGKPVEQYFGRETSLMIIRQPFGVLDQKGKFDVFVNVNGGGLSGQAGAVRHGISRALLQVDDENRPPL